MKKNKIKDKYIYQAVCYTDCHHTGYGPRYGAEKFTYHIEKQRYEKEFDDFYIYRDKVFYKKNGTQDIKEAEASLIKIYKLHYESKFSINIIEN